MARASYYAHFQLVEIQQTFYHPPGIATALRWRSEAPEGFKFTMKAWQLITHDPKSPTYRRLRREIPDAVKGRYGAFRPTHEVREAWEETMAFAQALGASIVVFQCPASFGPSRQNVANIRAFFEQVPRGGLTFAWEPRGQWPEGLILDLCKELDLVHCVDPFQSAPLWPSNLVYWRLHGIGGYRHQFREEELRCLLDRFRKRPVATYCLFNNLRSYEDAIRFNKMSAESTKQEVKSWSG